MSKLREIRINNLTKIIQEPGLDWEKEYLKKTIQKFNNLVHEIKIKKNNGLTQTEINYYQRQFLDVRQELYMLRFLANIDETNHKIFTEELVAIINKLNKMTVGDEWIV